MAIPHIVVLAAALLALLGLPCAVVVVCAEQAIFPRARRRLGSRERRALRRLDRSLSGRAAPAALPRPRPAESPLPCIEQIAAELRRLDRQRRAGPTLESDVWLAEVLRAYDMWLRLACHSLGVTEHLQQLDAIDRDIERVRVEGELQANGLALRSVAR
jgi:hypothetical protein